MMNRGWVVGAVVCAAAVSIVSPAAAAAPTGFEIGGRLSYGIPFGRLGSTTEGDASLDANKLNQLVVGQVRWDLDIGARVTPNIFIGGYGSVLIGIPGDNLDSACDRGDCSVAGFRLGVQGQYHFQPGGTDPWVGAGIGLDILGTSSNPDGFDAEETLALGGVEYLNLQGGVDFPLRDRGGLGPFAAFSLGQFSSGTYNCDGSDCLFEEIDFDLDEGRLHYWLNFGVRITYLP